MRRFLPNVGSDLGLVSRVKELGLVKREAEPLRRPLVFAAVLQLP